MAVPSSHLRAALVALAIWGAAQPAASFAQEPAPSSRPGVSRVLIGQRPPHSHFMVGMWGLHPFEPDFPHADPTGGIGGQWRGWFGATFVNSYGDRAFSAGVERLWLRVGHRSLGGGLGYRLGLVTGYDERLLPLARRVPALPMGGPLVHANVGAVGGQLFYVYRAMTLELSVRPRRQRG